VIDDVAVVAARIVARTRAEQGKPRHVTDPDTLNRVAAVLRRRPSTSRRAA
jgi:hypothetical protein